MSSPQFSASDLGSIASGGDFDVCEIADSSEASAAGAIAGLCFVLLCCVLSAD